MFWPARGRTGVFCGGGRRGRPRPETLTFNPNATVKWLPDNVLALGAYSDLDALALDGSAYALLVLFDGRPVREVREQMRTQKQADISDEVLLTLYRHRVLR